MRLCIFEDGGVESLEPLTLTRPAFSLWSGASTLLDKQRRAFPQAEAGLLVRPELAPMCRLLYPDLPVNDVHWLRDARVWVNARWQPAVQPFTDDSCPRVGVAGDQPAYLVLPAWRKTDDFVGDLETWLEHWKRSLPSLDAGGTLFHYPWDLIEHNPRTLCQDWSWFYARSGDARPRDIALQGPADRLVVDPEAVIEPFVFVDTRQGPVLIDRGAVVQSFSRLEGPCYIGAETWVAGAKLRGGSIGPACRVGGELEASIMLGHSNKYHDGFLGHSYLGEWVNIAAGTQTSDLRNDYGVIKTTIAGKRVSTGLTKVGAFIGDHTKTGLGALLNTGSVIGVFCNILPHGDLLPQVAPSFCQVRRGRLEERWDMQLLLATAATAMRRRGCELSRVHTELYDHLFEHTAERRRLTIQDSEMRLLRKTM